MMDDGNGEKVRLWESFLNLLFPLFCFVCGKPLEPDNRMFLCSLCLVNIRRIRSPVCGRCGRPGCNGVCAECRKAYRYYNVARAAGIYEGVLKECIHGLKYGRKPYLAKTLAGLMVDSFGIFPELAGCAVIVPVPLHRVRERERGFNQAHLLAKAVGNAVGVGVSRRNLRRVRDAVPQTGLPRSLRLSNVRELFSVGDPSEFADKEVLLIDDVLTTGSTADECSKTLVEAGAKTVSVLTAARGE